MKVAILQCDEVREVFLPQFEQYSEMIIRMFDVINASLEFEIFDCQKGHYPDDIDAYDFYITTGSKAGVYEELPWIDQLIKFIQKLDYHKKKLTGICFGHQIIAMALKGKVEKSDKGWGVGVATNRIINRPDWMKENESDHKLELNIIVSHQDQITFLPDDALVIAESDFCPYFVVQWNGHFLSVQGHPEWQTDYSRALMIDRKDIIPAERIEQGLSSLNIEPDNALFTHWIMDFVRY